MSPRTALPVPVKTYVWRMRTELPAERLHRRLGTENEPTADTDGDDESDAMLSRWLPDATADRAGTWITAVRADPRRSGAVALAAVGAVAVLVTLFTLMRDNTPPVASANLPPVQMVSSTSPAPPAAADGSGEPVVVSVAGLVHKPGLVTLDPGARIADALSAAGGPLDGADLLGLNMARRVVDGEQIIVGIASAPGEPRVMGSSVISDSGPPAAPGTSATTSTPGAPDGLVNLNTATAEQLETLPGIGPVTAAAIVAWRDANGKFDSVDQLGDVDGIGPARLQKLRDLVHV